MIIVYTFSAVAGALATSAMMWSHGTLEAALAAPIGGSLSVLLASVWALSRSSEQKAHWQAKRKVSAHFTSMWTAAAHA